MRSGKATDSSVASTILDPVINIRGVGPGRSALLKKLGIETANDALWFFPRRYEDRREICKISELRPDRSSVVIVKVRSVISRRSFKRGIDVCTCEAEDDTGIVRMVWFNRKGLDKVLKEGTSAAIFGLPSFSEERIEFLNPDFEVVFGGSDFGGFTGIIPIYPSTAGLPVRWFRKFIKTLLEEYIPHVHEYLPQSIIGKRGLPGIREALMGMHRPGSEDHWKKCRNRLAYEEFLLLQTALVLRKERLKRSEGAAIICPGGKYYSGFMESLPFDLTSAQINVLSEIFKDVNNGYPMSRLLQGDVGSGKTVIALALAAAGADAGIQTAIMAPTEVLAEQIYSQAQKFLSNGGLRCALLTGGLGRSEKNRITDSVARGLTMVVVGTHAMIQDGVMFRNLGTVIIDEQQRFGVMQRGDMLSRGASPHLLMMSATPIPRTISACLYGDMDISVIRDRPEGRKKIETRLVDFTRIRDLMQFMIDESAAGGRIYWICPRVEEDGQNDLVSVEKRHKFLEKYIGPLGIGSIHGKMEGKLKDAALEKFRSGETKVLVGTTVLEVGVDVPEASVVVIESPERYGLSQLHQLRGRVGRGGRRGVCLLLVNKTDEDIAERLKIILTTDDGFEIAESDHLLRGPGKISGYEQHGEAEFKIADIFRDSGLLEKAKEDAEFLVLDEAALSKEERFKDKLDIYLRPDVTVPLKR